MESDADRGSGEPLADAAAAALSPGAERLTAEGDTGNKLSRLHANTVRLEAFSDGVFAIALTLLVLDLKVPHLNDKSRHLVVALGHVLWEHWPEYFAFITSFSSVLIMWTHHHTLMRMVRKSDSLLLFANGFWLLSVTIVPFPTALAADYLMTTGAKLAATVYAGTFVLISISAYLLLLVVLRDGGGLTVSPKLLRRMKLSYASGPVIYLVAAALAQLDAWLAMGICTVMWIMWAVTAVVREEFGEADG